MPPPKLLKPRLTLYTVLVACLIIVVIFWQQNKNERREVSSGEIVEKSKIQWEIDAAKGDLDAAYSLLVFGDVRGAEFEKKLVELANKNHLASTMTLCTEYTGGSISGIKKDCALAKKWCTKAKVIDPNVDFHLDPHKKCPDVFNSLDENSKDHPANLGY